MPKRIGRGIVLVLFASATLLVGILIVPRLGNLFVGPGGIHDAAALPEQTTICGRGWRKDAPSRQLTLAAVRARGGIEPVIADPGLFAPCPAGACTRVAGGPCHTVIYVRVGEDAYLAYELQGGP